MKYIGMYILKYVILRFGEGNDNSLQYFSLGNPMERRSLSSMTSQKSQAQLSN